MRAPSIGRYGACIDNHPAGSHVLKRLARRVKVGENICAKRPFQLLGSNFEQRLLRMLLRRIVDENIKLAELFDRQRNGVGAKLRIAHVARDKHTASTYLFNSMFRGMRILMLVKVHNRDIGALAGKQKRDRSTNPAIASSD